VIGKDPSRSEDDIVGESAASKYSTTNKCSDREWPWQRWMDATAKKSRLWR